MAKSYKITLDVTEVGKLEFEVKAESQSLAVSVAFSKLVAEYELFEDDVIKVVSIK